MANTTLFCIPFASRQIVYLLGVNSVYVLLWYLNLFG